MTTTDDATSRLVRHPLRMRRLEVRSVERPTPRLARLGLGGPELAGFVSAAPDDHVKVFFPEPGDHEPVLPEIGPHGVVWPETGPRPVGRDYTPARVDDAGLLELDIVLHPGGHASDWVGTAVTGDVLGVAGPRGSHVLARPFAGYVLAADETGLPAVRRWLRELPAGVPVVAVVEVLDAEDHQVCDTQTDVTLHWVHREEGADLAGALRDVDFPAGDLFVWAGAEAGAVARVRHHVQDERGMPAAHVRARGYWKAGIEDHQEPHED